MHLSAAAAAWLTASRHAVVVEVVSARGSVPRDSGTRMLVAADAVLGTIGGGHLELQAIAQARAHLGRPDIVEQPLTLGPALGQCCGGALVLRYAPLNAESLASWCEPAPRFHLQLYGAGHVGRAIAHVLTDVPCTVQWIDEREAEFPPGALAAHIERISVDAVEAEVAHAPPGACFLVLTHSHDLDQRIVSEILRRGDFAYLGLIGSRTKAARFRHHFEARGVAASLLDRMRCPIGLDGIDGKEPGVIAIAVAAQLLAIEHR